MTVPDHHFAPVNDLLFFIIHYVVVGSLKQLYYIIHFLLHKPVDHGWQLFAGINIANGKKGRTAMSNRQDVTILIYDQFFKDGRKPGSGHWQLAAFMKDKIGIVPDVVAMQQIELDKNIVFKISV